MLLPDSRKGRDRIIAIFTLPSTICPTLHFSKALPENLPLPPEGIQPLGKGLVSEVPRENKQIPQEVTAEMLSAVHQPTHLIGIGLRLSA